MIQPCMVECLTNLTRIYSFTHTIMQDLIANFQEHSLSGNFPAIKTTLVYPYHEEVARLEGEYFIMLPNKVH